jgi:outer membrane lipoprotein
MNKMIKNFGQTGLHCFLVSFLLLSLGACTAAVSPQLMERVDRDLTYSSLSSRTDEAKGKIVLLGGTIVQTVPKPAQTEIEVVQKQIRSSGEPYLTDQSEGRFLVLVDHFLDPAIYRSGRDITVAGEFQGTVTRRLGEIDYPYPVIAGIELYLWKEPISAPVYPYHYYWRWWHYPGYVY